MTKSKSKEDLRFYFLLILSVVFFEGIAQYHIKKSKLTKNNLYILISILSYSIVCLLLQKCYDFNGVGITNLAWSIISIITMLTIGVIIFDEKITLYDILGVILCITGIYLIFILEHEPRY